MENRPLRNRSNREELLMRRRERDSRHAETWSTTVKYYDRVGKQNAKFDEWTSPRYYKSNNELLAATKLKCDKRELLEKRRERLARLLAEDERTYEVETVRAEAERYSATKRVEKVPVDVLKEINDDFKAKEEARRRAEAERCLYRQWRNNNPTLRDAQSLKQTKDLKLSWLDQQIEKRMAREAEEEETRRMVKEREAYVEEQKAKEEELRREVEAKEAALGEELRRQMEEIEAREVEARQLRQSEDETLTKRVELQRLQEKWEAEERRRKDREVALFNVRQHRRRLETKSRQIEEELRVERELLDELRRADLLDRVESAEKRSELARAMDEFSRLTASLRDVERMRREHLLFTFESEAKEVYDKFDRLWSEERNMRSSLVTDVLDELRRQIDANVEANRERQRIKLEEREAMLDEVRRYKEEMEKLREDEERRKVEMRKELDEQIKENRTRKKRLEGLERKRGEDEIERLRNEEERLKREIQKIQLGKRVPTYGQRRFFY